MVIVESLITSGYNEEKKYKYYYRLLRSELRIFGSQDSEITQCYGIEVERKDIVDGLIVQIERTCVERISPHRYKVHTLLKFLYDNTVSPIHMIDIIGEDIDEHVLEFEMFSKSISTC